MKKSIGQIAFGASVGTLASRSLGFFRNVVLAAAIGTGLSADAYSVANHIPHTIFLLLGGGTIANVFMPQLVNAASSSENRFNQFGSILILLALLFGSAVSILLLLGNGVMIDVVGGDSWNEPQRRATYLLAIWCIPQIVFYVLYAVLSQILNAKGKFSAVAWLPTVNSLAVIVACIPLIASKIVLSNNPDSLAGWPTLALGMSTLGGTAAQAFILMYLLWKAGFQFVWPESLRRMGLRQSVRVGTWALISVVLYQIANLVVMTLSTQAGAKADEAGFEGHGFTSIVYARALIYFAQAVTTASVANVLLQRLSKLYREDRSSEASVELNEVLLRIGSAVIPISGILFCLGPAISLMLFSQGQTSVQAATFIGHVLSLFAIGLPPFALQAILLRPFYAKGNGLAAFYSAANIGAIWIVSALGASWFLPPQYVALGLAASFSLSYLLDIPFKLHRLKIDFHFQVSLHVKSSYARMSVACFFASVATLLLNYGLHQFPPSSIGVIALAALNFVFGSVLFLSTYHLITRGRDCSIISLLHWFRK
jgi:putative peptidoglycan lipid II flippase